MPVLVEARDDEPRVDLTADLVLQRVAELERLLPLDLGPQALFVQARRGGVRKLVLDPQLAGLVRELQVEDVVGRVQETRHQGPAAPQHPERLGPHRADLGHEQVGDGVEHEVEAPVGERREVAHVALNGPQAERLAFGDEPVLRQLRRRVVEDGHLRSRGREDRALLPAAGGEAQYVCALHLREPSLRNRLAVRQQDFPLPAPGGLDDAGADRHGPLVPALDLPVPRLLVVTPDVHLVPGQL